MEQEVNIRIYRDGQYSLKDNLKVKAQILLPKLADKVDHFFTQH